ncbi:hypothetical protein PCANC_21015 [Puccinia coronata f. sp. avenae]|uniref:Uncharacterized protein n=1 Tax=Puccinia coronata f. sp. avenae TaxID=200324 RepID=A0A2N5U227_9BASI|nr:hypothetical protein PCANC_21015 [Puccinia coronata f. sp. avenae]PLW42374.1 hypothetical protein PCASD_06408 [Puccinia coronata f. sp. avenae]
MNQLQLSDLDTPYLPSASKIKVQCRVEISQSNSSSGGIQPCSMVQGHQPKLIPDQINHFTKAFQSFGGFINSLKLKRPPTQSS